MVRHVRWTIPQQGPPAAIVQVQLSSTDRQRFSARAPLVDQPETVDARESGSGQG
jgi:hypothetical protein